MVKTFGNKATRAGYGEGVVALGELNPNVVMVSLDLTESTAIHEFRKKWPNRFFNLGIAEQNGITVGAGLSLTGKIPFVSTFAVFASGRGWDQVRVSLCYSNTNVKIGATHAGITVGPDGASHQALEDIAIMQVLPRMTVLVPSDAVETKKATIAAAEIFGPVYIRSGRENIPIISDETTPFTIGKANVMTDGKDIAIIACGVMVYEALSAAEQLQQKGISARVINMHTIKPIDEQVIIKAAAECGAILTAEEHQIIGGLGSTVAEIVVRNKPVPMDFIGINDRFGESGDGQQLLKEYHLKDVDIISRAEQLLKRK
jgi:transketolase